MASVNPALSREVQFSSVAQSFQTLCNPMGCNTPDFPVHHQLLVCSNSCPLSRWCHPTISSSVIPFSSHLQSFPASGSFPMSQLFAWGGQRVGVSASASVPPMNTQDSSPLGWTGWTSLQSKGLWRVFSNTTVQKHQFFGAQLFSQSTSHPYMTTGKTIALTRQTFAGKGQNPKKMLMPGHPQVLCHLWPGEPWWENFQAAYRPCLCFLLSLLISALTMASLALSGFCGLFPHRPGQHYSIPVPSWAPRPQVCPETQGVQ